MGVYHCEEGYGSGGVVVDGDEVHEESSARHSRWEESSTKHNLLDPFSTWSGKEGNVLAQIV